MANWYGSARSNHFKVKDLEAFKKALSHVEISVHYNEENDTCVMLSEEEYGAFPSSYYSEEEEDSIDFDIASVVAPHLLDDQICVLVEVGAEKLRYLSGYAFAFDSTGEMISVSLDDIYAKAEERFGIKPTHASY